MPDGEQTILRVTGSQQVVFRPFHLLQQLLQAALELGADGVGLITTSPAAAPDIRPLLGHRLRVLQEEAGYHLPHTHTHTERPII